MMELTGEEKVLFDNIDKKIELGRVYFIAPDRPNRTHFIDTIKKYHDCFGTIEFNNDYTKFKKIKSFNQILTDIKNKEEHHEAIIRSRNKSFPHLQ